VAPSFGRLPSISRPNFISELPLESEFPSHHDREAAIFLATRTRQWRRFITISSLLTKKPWLSLSPHLQLEEPFKSSFIPSIGMVLLGAMRAFRGGATLAMHYGCVVTRRTFHIGTGAVLKEKGETMSSLVATVLDGRKVRAKFAPYAAIPLRLIVGYGFLVHGLAKWSKGPETFAGILHGTGVPLPHLMAWLTIATEIVSGMAFLIGAFVPLVSIPATILLAVAIFTVHLPYGFSSIKLLSVNNGRAQFGPPGYECDLLYIACIVALVLTSPSPWSVDRSRSRIHNNIEH
jgi:putative oxidoreductase